MAWQVAGVLGASENDKARQAALAGPYAVCYMGAHRPTQVS